jgi:hypothetical protein
MPNPPRYYGNYIYPPTILLVKIYESSIEEKLSFAINEWYVFALVKTKEDNK